MVVAWVFGRNVYSSTIIWNPFITTWSQSIATASCLVTTIVAYTKVFCTLRHNKIHVQNNVAQGQPSQANPLNIARYRNLQCTVGAGNIVFLLSAVYHSGRFDASKRDTYIRIPCLEFYAYFIVLKLVFKSLALLLEDR